MQVVFHDNWELNGYSHLPWHLLGVGGECFLHPTLHVCEFLCQSKHTLSHSGLHFSPGWFWFTLPRLVHEGPPSMTIRNSSRFLNSSLKGQLLWSSTASFNSPKFIFLKTEEIHFMLQNRSPC